MNHEKIEAAGEQFEGVSFPVSAFDSFMKRYRYWQKWAVNGIIKIIAICIFLWESIHESLYPYQTYRGVL
jgi:hypothetical protein